MKSELTDIRPKELWLATQPVESKYWHSSSGEEYIYIADNKFVVINEKVGVFRQRLVCKIIGTFWIEPMFMLEIRYQTVIKKGIESLFNQGEIK